ncbi:MAG TPA: fluoride efflux transporter CrcB, partial [Thermoanaerobaculia bacterium]
MNRFFWICLGGAAGTGARYLVSGWALQVFGTALPWGTLAVNLVGSFFIGAVMHVGLTSQLISPTVRLALTTGVLGGFTTYSSFNYETLQLFQEGAWRMGVVNMAGMLLGCLAAGAAG